jgi:endonuclease III
MSKRELFDQVIAYFQKEMPIAETELEYKSPYELLVAVILSAQCTDKRVNLITPDLLMRFPTAEKWPKWSRMKFLITSGLVRIPTTKPNIWWGWPACL